MVDGDRRDHRHRAVGDVGVVPGPAHADLDHGDVHRGVGEDREGHADEHLEERQRSRLACVDQVQVGLDLLVGLDEPLGGQRHPVQADPLGDGGQVRAGEQPGAQPAGAQQRLGHPGGRRLAVGAGQVDRPGRRAAGRRAARSGPGSGPGTGRWNARAGGPRWPARSPAAVRLRRRSRRRTGCCDHAWQPTARGLRPARPLAHAPLGDQSVTTAGRCHVLTGGLTGWLGSAPAGR